MVGDRQQRQPDQQAQEQQKVVTTGDREPGQGAGKDVSRVQPQGRSVRERPDQPGIIKVVDADTDKVIKEIPAEEIQHLIARIKETIGLLVDEKI